MKRLFYLCLCLSTLLYACTQEKGNLKGVLTEVETDTLLVQSMIPGQKGSVTIDTIILDQGKFSTAIPDSTLRFVYIMQKPRKIDGKMHVQQMINQPIIFLPGDKLILNGTLENYEVSGSMFYKEYNKLDKVFRGLEKQIMEMDSKFRNMYKTGANMDSIRQLYQKMVVPYQDSIVSLKEQYIRKNPNNLLSGYYFTQLPIQSVGTFYTLLGDDVKKGFFSSLIAATYQDYQNFTIKEKAKAFIQPGKPAPNFTLNDLQDKPFSLSSLKGKYAVLDFWGTWCGWCIKGFPEMKSYYDKYKTKVEFVGIDCGDTKEEWKTGVNKYQLPWINVYNGKDSKITNEYAIEGYPTKIIIDPQGDIIKIVIGESPEFYETLDSLLSPVKLKMPAKKK